MNKPFSIYLDLVRFVAACLVVIYHSNARNIVTDILPFSNFGHEAVIVFFVLSGFVIAYITDTKENTPKTYWASRLARIYSLAIPVIILTPILDIIGESYSEYFYRDKTTHDYWYIRILSSFLFINEIWGMSIMSFSNVPYWSLCYEMWYYILFSVYTFMHGLRRLAVIVFIVLALGPKIVLLAPLWITGVIIYRWKILQSISIKLSYVILVTSLVGIYYFYDLNLKNLFENLLKTWIGENAHHQLTFSKFFIGDYIFTVLIFMNFVAVRRLAPLFHAQIIAIERPIKFLSSFTFSLYIFHQPFILFYAALLNLSPNGYVFYTLVMALVLTSILAIGFLIERRRYLLRIFISKFL